MAGAINTLRGCWRIPAIRRGISLTLLASFCLYVVQGSVLAPAQARLAQYKADAIAVQTRLDNLASRVAMAGDFDRLSAERDALRARFQAGVERSDLVEQFAAMSASSGTRIIHGSNSFGQPLYGVTPLKQDLTVEGSYAQIRAFLQALSQAPTLTLPVSVEFTANDEGTLVRARISLVTYAGGGA